MGAPLLIDASCFKYWAYALLVGGYSNFSNSWCYSIINGKTLCYL